MRIRLAVIALIAMGCVLLSGCFERSTKPDKYDTYIQLVQEQNAAAAAERKARLDAFATMAQKCSGDSCVQAVAVTAALAGGAGAGSNGPAPIQPPAADPPSFWAQAALTLLNGNLAGTLVNGAVNWHQSDNATKTQLGQYNFLNGAVANMRSSINVQGNYVPGNYYTGGYIGGSVSGPGAGIGNTYNRNTTVDGTGNATNGSTADNSHDNRTNSPGPYDNSNNGGAGGNCTSGNAGNGATGAVGSTGSGGTSGFGGAGGAGGNGGNGAPGGSCPGGAGGTP